MRLKEARGFSLLGGQFQIRMNGCSLNDTGLVRSQGCALAEPDGPWHLTFALGRLENLRFSIQIICWAPQILQFQSTGLPLIFLRAQPWISHQTEILTLVLQLNEFRLVMTLSGTRMT